MSFQSKRMGIFREVVRLAYKKQLKDKVDDIPYMFTEYTGDKNHLTAIKNEILTVMGLDPIANFDTELSKEVDLALKLDEVKEPLVTVNRNICRECQQEKSQTHCVDACIYDDMPLHSDEGPIIESGKCISCGKCIPKCPFGALSDKIEFIPLIDYLEKNVPVYAAVAPAFVGQFGRDVTPGKLRSALKSIGFTDMVEVALFADMVALREADEFIHLVKNEEDFLITSCCCPVWVNLLLKHYGKLSRRLTKTVSPMIASGRVIKTIFPEAKTVFIGPCIAKKAEAKHPELKGAIDYVLTFSELDQIFKALEIRPSDMPEDNKEQSSYGGRIFGRTGGVSQAVKTTVERVDPNRVVKFKAHQADGVNDCKKLLDELKEKKVDANFIEGMGCEGGCVGGPRRNIDVNEGTRIIEDYGREASVSNPIDNIKVKGILKFLRNKERNYFERILLREYKH